MARLPDESIALLDKLIVRSPYGALLGLELVDAEEDLVATARVRRRGREISTGEVSVCDAEGREVAVALVSYKLSPPA